ncbi:MAG TPA: efflux RND transporter periplasmic adaptor subunit [Myxococcaceae bacterium]|nr:efflux RND transporter periplasmic adaptor subunit [Myxococcaceae bacterium]
MRTRAFLSVALVAGLFACSKPPAGQSTSVGDLRVELAVVPDPPTTGDNRLLVTVRDAAGRPVEGARLAFEYLMPGMGSMPEMKGGGTTESLGGGRYSVRYPLQMNGDWTLTLGVDAPGHSHAQVRLMVSPPRKGFTLESAGPEAMTESPRGLGKPLVLSPYRQQLLGVRFGTVESRELSRSLRGFGQVDVDERQLADVTLKYEAYVEALIVAETGKQVRTGDRLLTLYSPDLLSAEEEYLASARGDPEGASRPLQTAAARRLRLWGLSPEDLERLRARGTSDGRLTLRSPAGGVVLEKNVVTGSRVMPGDVLFRIGNLGRVWVQAQFYESEAPFVAVGQPAVVSIPAAPGERIEGRVSFVAPRVDLKTRTLEARIEVANPHLLLKPGMFADVRVERSLGKLLSVPSAALLASGEHRYAFVERGEGRLQPVEVVAGASAGDLTEVRSGLEEKDRVVIGPTFLLGSEAQLRDALPRWSAP